MVSHSPVLWASHSDVVTFFHHSTPATRRNGLAVTPLFTGVTTVTASGQAVAALPRLLHVRNCCQCLLFQDYRSLPHILLIVFSTPARVHSLTSPSILLISATAYHPHLAHTFSHPASTRFRSSTPPIPSFFSSPVSLLAPPPHIAHAFVFQHPIISLPFRASFSTPHFAHLLPSCSQFFYPSYHSSPPISFICFWMCLLLISHHLARYLFNSGSRSSPSTSPIFSTLPAPRHPPPSHIFFLLWLSPTSQDLAYPFHPRLQLITRRLTHFFFWLPIFNPFLFIIFRPASRSSPPISLIFFYPGSWTLPFSCSYFSTAPSSQRLHLVQFISSGSRSLPPISFKFC